MGNKVILYCGECDNFLYEDTDGYGFCLKSDDVGRCSDECHLSQGKPQWATTLASNELRKRDYENERTIIIGHR